jgi:hypothetical protein
LDFFEKLVTRLSGQRGHELADGFVFIEIIGLKLFNCRKLVISLDRVLKTFVIDLDVLSVKQILDAQMVFVFVFQSLLERPRWLRFEPGDVSLTNHRRWFLCSTLIRFWARHHLGCDSIFITHVDGARFVRMLSLNYFDVSGMVSTSFAVFCWSPESSHILLILSKITENVCPSFKACFCWKLMLRTDPVAL